MRGWTHAWLVRCALVAACACRALGASGGAVSNIPPREEGSQGVTASIVNNQLTVRYTGNNAAWLAPSTTPLHGDHGPGIITTVTHQVQPMGVDVIFHFRNGATVPQKIGYVRAGILNLGQAIEFFNFRILSTPVAAQSSTFVGQSYTYPDDLYSPVMVMRNQSLAVGVSLLYPLMDYRHCVRTEFNSPGSWMATGEAGRGWNIEFRMSNRGGENQYTHLPHEAILQPGEQRTYVMCIRWTWNTSEWQRTLLPYRDYFRALYGGVRYQREDEPIVGQTMATTESIRSDNPYGYALSNQFRPDLVGWGPVVSRMLTTTMGGANSTWRDTMLWAPTGLYSAPQSLAFNYPYQFTSQWNASATLATATNPSVGLPRLHAAGKNLGLWWGRALQVADRWNPTRLTNFDPDNPRHVTLAKRELDSAVAAGARYIGLDTFTPGQTPAWKLVPWLERMQQEYPTLKFVTEPSQFDVLHTLCPTYIEAYNPSVSSRPATRDGYFQLTHPNYLADFLLPGHETWGAMSYHILRSYEGDPTHADVEADLRRIASYGYRPLLFWSSPKPANLVVAQTWETTVPASLRESDRMITNLRAGRAANDFGLQAATNFRVRLGVGGQGYTPHTLRTNNIASNDVVLFTEWAGEYPPEGPHLIAADPTWMSRHVESIRRDLQYICPDPMEDRLIVLDYESWWPAWLITQEPVRESWRQWIRTSEAATIAPMNAGQQEAYFKQTYEAFTRMFFEQTFAAMRVARPRAKISIYSLPPRTYWGFFGYGVTIDQLRALNDNELRFMYDLIDVICPSVYCFYKTGEPGVTSVPSGWEPYTQAWGYQFGMQSEAMRLARRHQRPVYPFVWFTYHHSGPFAGQTLTPRSLQTIVDAALAAQVHGVIIWDAFAPGFTTQAAWQTYFDSVATPILSAAIAQADAGGLRSPHFPAPLPPEGGALGSILSLQSGGGSPGPAPVQSTPTPTLAPTPPRPVVVPQRQRVRGDDRRRGPHHQR